MRNFTLALLCLIVAISAYSVRKYEFGSDDQLLVRAVRTADKDSSEEGDSKGFSDSKENKKKEESEEEGSGEAKRVKRSAEESSEEDDKKKKASPGSEEDDKKKKNEKKDQSEEEGSGEVRRVRRNADKDSSESAEDGEGKKVTSSSDTEGSGELVTSPLVRVARDGDSHSSEESSGEAPSKPDGDGPAEKLTRVIREVEGSGSEE
ncbi:hypothetical protein RB195_014085 [Necator americanus]|uniref:Uncharacterized protein n=1 Tax=Necator americanus TaxID=51031 RepID=A0ABR1DYJ8_NECAM